MRRTKTYLAVSAVALATVIIPTTQAQVTGPSPRPSFPQSLLPLGKAPPEAGPNATTATEAPTGYDNLSNGFLSQGTFNSDRATFEEVETVATGLGPTYNAQSCRECHQNVVTGHTSQIAELRTGRMARGQFFSSQGGSIIQARSTWPDIVEQVGNSDNVRTLRITTSALGDGFVECIADATLQAIASNQPSATRGTAIEVSVLEASSAARVGRFGWKCQHASLVSFSADAYLNEVGITSPLFPAENLADGMYVGSGTQYDPVPDPEDDGSDIAAFAAFMRSTKAPARGPITSDVTAGATVFANLGCAVCHVPSITTAPAGTVINGGAFTVPSALGNKVIHPYSDFLLHNVGTGDGIPIQTGAQFASTANQMRTAPLWGLRTRNRLMHDGLSLTITDAITRHGGQAQQAAKAFNALNNKQESQVLAFLNSL